METFTGAALPAPWGTNPNSTGKVQTDLDADQTMVTDQTSKQRISRTNALGQLINVWEVKEADSDTEAVGFGGAMANALKTSYQYDALNNLKKVLQGGQVREFAYDSLSRLQTATNPESGLISYTYDNNGNLATKTDARPVTTSYLYDNLNRVTNRNYSAPANLANYQATPNVTYTYDETNVAFSKGRLTKVTTAVTATNPLAETRYLAFDNLGRVTSSQQVTDGVTYNPQSYVYNLSGALKEETYPSGRVVRNTLDQTGDLAQVESQANTNADFHTYANSFTYTAAGAVSSLRLGNGRWENTQFNSRLQPIQIGLGSSAVSQNLLKLNYEYGATAAQNNGNVTKQTITVPTIGTNPNFVSTQSYTYDSLNRIKDATENITGQTNPNWKQTFLYDRFGNRTFDTNNGNTNTLAAGCPTNVCNPSANVANNRLNGTTYDDAGNTTVDGGGAASGNRFVYDAENKQVQVSNASGIVGQYFYDGDGKRVKKIVYTNNTPSETTIFVYDASGKMVAEYSTVTANTPQISYLTNDTLGSPRITTDANGAVISRRDFMPFGEEISRAGYGSDNVRQKFTAYERDNESSLDFAQARMYANSQGRFTSVDPENFGASVFEPQSWNGYTYSLNNPLNITDPTGLIWGRIGDGAPIWYNSEDELNAAKATVYSPTNNQYQATDGRWVQLDGNSANWNYIDPPNQQNALIQSSSIITLMAGSTLTFPLLGGSGVASGGAVAGGTVTLSNPVVPAIVIGGGILGWSVWNGGPDLMSPTVPSRPLVPNSATNVGVPPFAINNNCACSNPNVFNKSKQNKKVAESEITSAETELGKFLADGPNGIDRNHHAGEVRGILIRVKRLVERLVGKEKQKQLDRIEKIERELNSQ